MISHGCRDLMILSFSFRNILKYDLFILFLQTGNDTLPKY